MVGMTARQKEIYDFMLNNKKEVYPTYKEIGEHFGIKAAAVYQSVQLIIKKGFFDADVKKRGKKTEKT